MKKKFSAFVVAAFVLAGCDTPAETVALTAGVGTLGAAAVGGSLIAGAAIGAGVGLICEASDNCN
ncbi:MAG: hypothetical protein ACU0CA_17810 [Paracoccaceae bacterium]